MPYPNFDPLDWSTIQPYVDALLDAELTAESARAWLRQWSDLTSVLYEAQVRIQRAMSENTTDKEAEAQFKVLVEEILPKARVADQALRDRLLALNRYSPAEDEVELLKRFQAEVRVFDERNVPILSELMKLGNQYDKIAGGLSIDWDGQTETLPQAQSHLRQTDRAERERAWRLIMDAYLSRREALNELYMQMLDLRRQVARNASLPGYRDYKWLELARFDYTPEDCMTFHDAIEHEVVPLARELYAERARKLGIAALRPWDVDVDPAGEPLKPFQDVSELEEGAARIFNRVDPTLAGYFEVMRDGYLDLASRPNKAPGGYCEGFPVTGKPYIFMNAAGAPGDVSTILHEGGHSFHFMESRRQPLVWNHNGPMEFCEVASMSMELLSAPYLTTDQGGFYNEADARRAHADDIRGIVQFLPYMAVVDAFQHWVYADAPLDVTITELDAKWAELWDRFMPGIDYTGLEDEKATGWHRKLHIFHVPFSYVEYGLAQLGALQVWRNAQADQARAVADYRAALALGNTRGLSELFRAAGATFAFDRRTVGDLMAMIRRRLDELAA
jgi:oligoendopeptidase F